MARKDPKKEVVIVGLGWTGAILGIELANEGLDILALERGEDRETVPDFKYPNIADELKYAVRHELMQRPSHSTLTIRRDDAETALPYRNMGSFLPGNGVGGAGVHWNGHTWRPQPEELRLYSYTKERFGKDIIPDDMLLQDYPVTYEELEPYFDRFERMAGVSGMAGNLNGKKVDGGNVFEGFHSRDYAMPPTPPTYNSMLFAGATKDMGLHPFSLPGSIASQSYVNEYGMQMGPCNFCGFCERFGCYNYSKGSPQVNILGALKRKPNFAYKTHAEVLKVEMSKDGKTAKGVTYFDRDANEEVYQEADLVILCAFELHNVHMMLYSGIGEPYNPTTGEGVVGRGYAYQMTGGTTLFFKDKDFNPFVGHGSNASVIDDFGTNQIDFDKEGFIGGSYISSGMFNGRPIRSMPLPEGTPSWGKKWKKGIGDWYGHSMSIGSHGSCMSYKDSYLDLDPTYKDSYGRPLLRMTFNWHDNDIRMTQYMRKQTEAISKKLKPDSWQSSFKDFGAMYDVRPYQTTHTVGGTAIGNDPKTSVINRYQQVHGVHNLFLMGAGAFPQNIQYNPTGLLGGLAYWSAHAIIKDYLANPRSLA